MAANIAHLTPVQRAERAVQNYSKHIKAEEDFIKNDAYPTPPSGIKARLHTITCGCFRYKPLEGDALRGRYVELRTLRGHQIAIVTHRLNQIAGTPEYSKIKKAYDAVVRRQVTVDRERREILTDHLAPLAAADRASIQNLRAEFDRKVNQKLTHHNRVLQTIEDEIDHPETQLPVNPPKPGKSVVKTAIQAGAILSTAATVSDTLGFDPTGSVPTVLRGGRVLFDTALQGAGLAAKAGTKIASGTAKLAFGENTASAALDSIVSTAENIHIPQSLVHAATTGLVTHTVAGAAERAGYQKTGAAIRAVGTAATVIPAVKNAASALGVAEPAIEVVATATQAVQTGSTVLQRLKPVTDALSNPGAVLQVLQSGATEAGQVLSPLVPAIGPVISTVAQAARENPIPAVVAGTVAVVATAAAVHKYGVVEPAKKAIQATLINNSKYTIPTALVAIGAGAAFAAPAAIGAGTAFLLMKVGSAIAQATKG